MIGILAGTILALLILVIVLARKNGALVSEIAQLKRDIATYEENARIDSMPDVDNPGLLL